MIKRKRTGLDKPTKNTVKNIEMPFDDNLTNHLTFIAFKEGEIETVASKTGFHENKRQLFTGMKLNLVYGTYYPSGYENQTLKITAEDEGHPYFGPTQYLKRTDGDNSLIVFEKITGGMVAFIERIDSFSEIDLYIEELECASLLSFIGQPSLNIKKIKTESICMTSKTTEGFYCPDIEIKGDKAECAFCFYLTFKGKSLFNEAKFTTGLATNNGLYTSFTKELVEKNPGNFEIYKKALKDNLSYIEKKVETIFNSHFETHSTNIFFGGKIQI